VLTSIAGTLNINSNERLTTSGGAFPVLTTVTGLLGINSNRVLTNFNGGLSALTTIGRLAFYQNGNYRGGSTLTFCTNVRARFCPMTVSWQNGGSPYDTDDCCQAYCSSSSTC
jgi:hypothetical protein